MLTVDEQTREAPCDRYNVSTMLTLAFTISMHAATVLMPEAYGRTDTVTAMPGRVSRCFTNWLDATCEWSTD